MLHLNSNQDKSDSNLGRRKNLVAGKRSLFKVGWDDILQLPSMALNSPFIKELE